MKKYAFKSIVALTTLMPAFLVCASATAAPLVFQGQNAGLFSSANPADTADLMNSVRKSTDTIPVPAESPGQLIEESLEGQISTRVYNDTFSDTNPIGVAVYNNLGNGYSTTSVRNADGTISETIVSPTGTTNLLLQ